MKIPAALLILVLATIPVPYAQNGTTNLNEWKKVDACGVTFHLPRNVQETKVYPVDSCVKRYRGGDVDITLDVIYSQHTARSEKLFRSSGTDEPEFQIREIQIAGVRSLIKSYYKVNVPEEKMGLNYLSVLLVPHIGKDKRGLMMRAYSKSAEGQVIIMKTFESISPRNKNYGE